MREAKGVAKLVNAYCFDAKLFRFLAFFTPIPESEVKIHSMPDTIQSTSQCQHARHFVDNTDSYTP